MSASRVLSKGQIMSECIYDIINFPKYHRKNLIDFCPGRFYRLGTYVDCYAPLLIFLINEKKCASVNSGLAIIKHINDSMIEFQSQHILMNDIWNSLSFKEFCKSEVWSWLLTHWFVLIILKLTPLRWVHNRPSLNKLSGQESIKKFCWYFGKSMIS